MTACEWVETVTAYYVGGELPSPDAARLERHLTHCPACRGAVEQYREVIRLAGSLPPHEPPPSAAERILAALRAAGNSPDSGALDETQCDLPLARVKVG
jgi:anti-sigma factor RsiW